MTMRTLYLISYRNVSSQRAHFAIWVPSAAQPEKGTLIHVVGAPMAGYKLEFKRNYRYAATRQSYEIFPIGQVHSANIVDSTDDDQKEDSDPKGNIEIAAAQVPPPRISQNIMAPVNDVSIAHHFLLLAGYSNSLATRCRPPTEDAKNGLRITSAT